MERSEVRPAPRGRRRRGAVLLEFALTALILYFLVAAAIELGRAMLAAQTVQQAADVAARELSRTRLPVGASFAQALEQDAVRRRLYDARRLVIDLDALGPGESLDDLFAGLPLVNQQLRPLMILDSVDGKRLLRYPGALLQDPDSPSGFTVAVPLVVARDAGGVETIRWVPVVEEATPGAFSIGPTQPGDPWTNTGTVSIRINYPFQAATVMARRQPDGPFERGPVILADDAGVVEENSPPAGTLGPGTLAGPYSGPYGLGKLLAYREEVRPFRRVLTGQSVGYRRELSLAGTGP